MIASHGAFTHSVVSSQEKVFSATKLVHSLTTGFCEDLMGQNMVVVLLLFVTQPLQDLPDLLEVHRAVPQEVTLDLFFQSWCKVGAVMDPLTPLRAG